MQNLKFTELANFQDKQKEAWFKLMEELSKYGLYGGAAAGGKSYFLRWAAIGLGMYYYAKYKIKNIPIGLFSEDYPTLKDRQVVRIKHEIPAFLGRLTETRDLGYAFVAAPEYGEFIVMLRNLDDPSKYASTEFAAVLVEELTKNPRETFDDLRFRLRYPGINDPKFMAATNPGSIGHGWVKSLWVDKNENDPERDRFFYIPAKYSDNKYVDASYVEQLKSLPEQKRKAYMDGSWDIFAGQYFSEFNRDLHVVLPFIPYKENIIVGGMDWGRSSRPSHKTAFYFSLDMVEKVYWEDITFFRTTTFMEVAGKEKTPKEWAQEIKERLKFYNLRLKDISWIRGDPAMFTKQQDMSISIADQFKEEGIYITPASNDRIGGWEVLHKWLSIAPDGKPYWQITSNCEHLVRTLPELVHDENRVEDVDTDGEDHPGDSERYKHKHLKWIDGHVGGVTQGLTKRNDEQKIFFADINDQGRQIPVDFSKFKK